MSFPSDTFTTIVHPEVSANLGRLRASTIQYQVV